MHGSRLFRIPIFAGIFYIIICERRKICSIWSSELYQRLDGLRKILSDLMDAKKKHYLAFAFCHIKKNQIVLSLWQVIYNMLIFIFISFTNINKCLQKIWKLKIDIGSLRLPIQNLGLSIFIFIFMLKNNIKRLVLHTFNCPGNSLINDKTFNNSLIIDGIDFFNFLYARYNF